MMQNFTSKLALFVDGAKLHATAKALGFDIDYRRLLEEFSKRGMLLRAFYYTTLMEDLEYCTVRPLVDWLDYNGFTVVTKPAKEFVDETARRRVKASMDIDLAVGAMDIADHVDEIVLFLGDGNFRSLVAALQRRGIRVTVVSSVVSEPPIASDELRRQADEFIELADLETKIARVSPSATRPGRQSPATATVQRRRSQNGLAERTARSPDSASDSDNDSE
jgi:uncharacterized LabA/DUF88 family protein